MTGDSELKEVRFDKYCPTCVNWSGGKELLYKETTSEEAPKLLICDECLEESMRLGTEVPLRWKKA